MPLKGRMQMDPELRPGRAQGGQGRDHGDFPAFEIQAGPGVNVAEAFDKVAPEVRRDVLQTFDHLFPNVPVDPGKHGQACLVSRHDFLPVFMLMSFTWILLGDGSRFASYFFCDTFSV